MPHLKAIKSLLSLEQSKILIMMCVCVCWLRENPMKLNSKNLLCRKVCNQDSLISIIMGGKSYRPLHVDDGNCWACIRYGSIIYMKMQRQSFLVLFTLWIYLKVLRKVLTTLCRNILHRRCFVKVCFYHHRPSFVTCHKFCALLSSINYNDGGKIYDFSEIKFQLLFIGNRRIRKSSVLPLSSMQRRVSMSVNAHGTQSFGQIWHWFFDTCFVQKVTHTHSVHQMWINNRTSQVG